MYPFRSPRCLEYMKTLNSSEASPLVLESGESSRSQSGATKRPQTQHVVMPKSLNTSPSRASSTRIVLSYPGSPYTSQVSWIQVLRRYWPVFVEFGASFITVLAGLMSGSGWGWGLVFAGLANATSNQEYYLQANPVVTLGQLLRRFISAKQAAMYWLAQLLGTALAVGVFALTANVATPGSLLLLPARGCGGDAWGRPLLAVIVYTTLWLYITLASFDTTALSLEPCCTFYGLAAGAAFGAATSCASACGLGTGLLLNPWVAVFAVLEGAVFGGGHTAESGSGFVACAAALTVGPILGAVVATLLTWLTSITGDEKQEIIRNLAPAAVPLVEALGVSFLVLSLVASSSATGVLTTGAVHLGLSFCAWRRSGAQFSPSVTLTVWLLKRQLFRWTSVVFYAAAHLVGAVLGTVLLLSIQSYAAPAPVTTAGSTLSALLYALAYICAFVANNESDFDVDGFLHPCLMTSLAFTGLLQASSGIWGTVGSGLFNPWVTMVLWDSSGTPFLHWLLISVVQFVASVFACGICSLRALVVTTDETTAHTSL